MSIRPALPSILAVISEQKMAGGRQLLTVCQICRLAPIFLFAWIVLTRAHSEAQIAAIP